MTQTTQLLIFDMDGLMLDTETIAVKSWKEVLERFGYQFDHDFTYGLFGFNETQMEISFKKQYGQDFPFLSFQKDFTQTRLKIIGQEGKALIKYGLIELLEYASKNHIKTAVATSTYRKIVDWTLDLCGLTNYFDTVVCGDEIKHSKPDPEIFLKAAKKTNTPVDNAIVLEDSSNGIKAAHSAGMRCIWIKDIGLPPKEIQSLAWAKPQNLKEVIPLLEK